MSDTGFWIEPLVNSHERTAFDCGNDWLNDWLNDYIKRYARQNTANGASRTFVAVRPTEPRVCGYFTLSAGAVALTDFPENQRKGWPRLVPTAHLGRLAVDKEFHGQGLGNALMRSALQTALEAAEKIGIATVELWAIDDTARAYYSRFGFVALLDDPLHLYLTLRAVRDFLDL